MGNDRPFKLLAYLPNDSGAVVGLTGWDEQLIVACEHGVYAVTEDGQCFKLESVVKRRDVWERQ
jgi:hypothetical protein